MAIAAGEGGIERGSCLVVLPVDDARIEGVFKLLQLLAVEREGTRGEKAKR